MHNRLLSALLGGAGGLGNLLILLILFFLLIQERRGHRGRICLSHDPRWPSGDGLQANPGSRGQLEKAPHRLRHPNPQKLPGPHIPSSGFGAMIRMPVTHQRALACGPSVYHFPQAQPPILLSRQGPQSRPPPPQVCLSLDAGCWRLRPSPSPRASPLPILPWANRAADES